MLAQPVAAASDVDGIPRRRRRYCSTVFPALAACAAHSCLGLPPMPPSLVHRVPSTARSLFTLDEDEHLIPASRSFDRKIGACTREGLNTSLSQSGLRPPLGSPISPPRPPFDSHARASPWADTLTEHIGSGSSGSNVFAAWLAAAPSELVAVKVLEEHPTACALPRFLREAEITCSLGPHPNLVRGLKRGAHP